MAEEATEQDEPTATVEPDDTELGEGGKKALDAERKARRDAEARLKELEPLAAKAKEMEDAKKSEQERVAEQLEAARAEGSEAKATLLRLDVAFDKAPEGMPLSQVRKLARRLSGSTKEELEADADELFADFAPAVKGEERSGGRPKERLRPGAAPDVEPEKTPQELADAVIKRRGY